ncbi:MAG: hypothetical protein WC331_11350 [Candidatus Omnitrophota bacterium]|jgi:hypothetical protein
MKAVCHEQRNNPRMDLEQCAARLKRKDPVCLKKIELNKKRIYRCAVTRRIKEEGNGNNAQEA